MSHYTDDGYLHADNDELELVCDKCGVEFIDLKSKHTDDEGFITGPFFCKECEEIRQ